MEKQLLFSENGYSIWRYKGIPEEAMNFLDSIAWGNDGAVYEHRNTEEHIRLLHQPTLLAIRDHDQVQGTAVFCNTPVTAGNACLNCYYIRYFAASQEIRGKGVMKKYSVKVMEAIRDNEKDKTVFFACIEKGNRASYRAVENAGYRNIGTMKTNGFSRFFPKKKKHIERAGTIALRDEITTLLQEQYRAHALVQFNSAFLNNDYYIIRENGVIVAGCQFHRAHWVINKMNGFSGKMITNLVPYIPLLNRLFNPKCFKFLAFECIYVKPGYEQRLMELFEGLLAKEKMHSAMFWMGETCPVRQQILATKKTGLLHSFVKDSDAYIMASFHGLEENEINNITSRPLFASAFDYI